MNGIRLLRADEIECRVGTVKKGKGCSLLLYKTARTDMNILDEVFGMANWQTEHYEVKGKDFCRIGIRVDGEWIWKSDCGAETNVEAEKGESSDAMKRAGTLIGIGRSLYTSPFIWVKLAESDFIGERMNPSIKFTVKDIKYDSDEKICYLEIFREDTKEVVFTWGDKASAEVKFDPVFAYRALTAVFKDKVVVNAELKKKGADRPSAITPEIFDEVCKVLNGKTVTDNKG